MALPQTINQTTLNLSGKPTISTAPTTAVTLPESKGAPSPQIVDEEHKVNPLLGGLFGGLLGYAAQNRGAGAGGTGIGGTGAGGTQAGSGNLIADLIKKITGGSQTGMPTGNIGSVDNVVVPSNIPLSEAQAWLDSQYGTTNGESNYVVSGTNMSTGQAIGTVNTNIGPNWGGNTSTQGSTGTGTNAGSGSGSTSGLTNLGGGYFMNSYGDVYDSTGTLIYQNPSDATTGTQTETSGGGYDPNVDPTQQYYENSNGDVYDYAGNLVLAFSNGYYYEPDTSTFYDAHTWDVVGSDFNPYTDFYNIPTLDTSGYGDLGNYFDYGNYTSGSTTYIKDGGSVKGGLATPLFRKGGSVPKFDTGGFIDQVVANQVPGAVTTTATPTTTSTGTTSTGGIGDLLGGLLSNKVLTGAGLGALLTSLINQQSSIPTNKGVDMTALGTLKPRTTTVGPARYVPYSEYGTPTAPYDYSQLYQNLGVSPFNAPTTAPTTPTAPTGGLAPATTPTTPTGALPTTPTTPSGTTPVAPSAPSYFADADGNIYDANGDLVYDITSGTATASSGTTTASPTTASALSSVAPTGTLAPTGTGDAYYSYGTPVTPSDVLGAKNGGLTKMAVGGTLKSAAKAIEKGAKEAKGALKKSFMTDAQLLEMESQGSNPIHDFSVGDSIEFEYRKGEPARGKVLNIDEENGKIDIEVPKMFGGTSIYSIDSTHPGIKKYALGGQPITENLNVPMSNRPFQNVPAIQGRGDYRQGSYVEGAGDGQSDDIPAMLADGEYVIDAETVAQLGNGSNKAGAKVLDQFRQNIRAHKRSAPHDKIPPKSKSPLAYLKGAK